MKELTKQLEEMQGRLVEEVKKRIFSDLRVELAYCIEGDGGLAAVTGKNSTSVIELSYEELEKFEKRGKRMKASDFKREFKHQRQDAVANFTALLELHLFGNEERSSRKGRPSKSSKLSAHDKSSAEKESYINGFSGDSPTV